MAMVFVKGCHKYTDALHYIVGPETLEKGGILGAAFEDGYQDMWATRLHGQWGITV